MQIVEQSNPTHCTQFGEVTKSVLRYPQSMPM